MDFKRKSYEHYLFISPSKLVFHSQILWFTMLILELQGRKCFHGTVVDNGLFKTFKRTYVRELQCSMSSTLYWPRVACVNPSRGGSVLEPGHSDATLVAGATPR